MSTMNLRITTFRPLHTSRWNELTGRIGEWRRRARSRYELTTLSDGSLRDIGLSRCDVDFEASKPFWQA
jgi:uncharacterized protein YjiS (DUF1127 family)